MSIQEPNSISIDEFRKAFEEWCQLRDWSLGPVIRPAKRPDEFKELYNILAFGLDEYSDQFEKPIVSLPSPWHAAFYLSVLQSECITRLAGHPLFRGHADSAWELKPTIDRTPNGSIERLSQIAESLAFTELLFNLHIGIVYFGSLGSDLNFSLNLPRSSYAPVVQHYGCSTHLLDFTTDPTVAIYFATRNVKNRLSDKCCVFTFIIDESSGVAENIHLKLVPPMFERPYLQKGVFLQSQIEGDVSSQFDSVKLVEFPSKPENEEFRVIRGHVVDILPESPEIETVKEISKSAFGEFLLKHNSTTVSSNELIDFIIEFVKRNEPRIEHLYKSYIRDPMRYFLIFVDEFEDMLYWICYYTKIDDKEGIGVDLEILSMIVRDNPEICLFISKMYAYFLKDPKICGSYDESKIRFLEFMITKIKESLKVHGVDPEYEITFENVFSSYFPESQ